MNEAIKKDNIFIRIIKKIIKWLIMLAVIIGFLIFYIDYRSDKKKEFYLETWTATKASCNGNTECIEHAKAKFKQCFKENYYTEKKGRFNREDKVDEEGLESCIKGDS